MEHNRENGNRGGHPGGDAPGKPQRQRPENGFEGMNYEQRRAPYNREQSNRNDGFEKPAAPSDDDLDSRSPV